MSLAIGNQTARSAARFLEPFEYALANGFEAFEWFPDKEPSGGGWDENDLSEDLRADIRASAKATHMRLSVHAHWRANPLEAESAPVLRRDLELAEALGAGLLNLHFYPQAGVGAYAKALEPLLRQAAACQVQLAIENTVETSPHQLNELFGALLGGRDSHRALRPPVGLCLDIGHANLCAATRNDYLGFVEQLDPQVPMIHLHLHENWGDADTHLPLFTGPAASNPRGLEGLVRRLQQRQYHGSVILEQWPNPPVLLKVARERLLELWQRNAAEQEERGLGGEGRGARGRRTAKADKGCDKGCDKG